MPGAVAEHPEPIGGRDGGATMDPGKRQFIETKIANLLNKKEQLQWLTDQNVQARKIASFGCGKETETLALMWALGADEAVGIDRDEEGILSAQKALTYIKEGITIMQRMLRYRPELVPEHDKTWWNDVVPDFFKTGLFKEGVRVVFCVHDITESTGLASDYYDLAFCDFVLHHIWFDDKRKNAREDTQIAIGEMARVVKPGGVVAAFELIQFSDKPRLDFRPLFEQAGLKSIYTKETVVETALRGPGVTAEYLYEKS
jgi:SAM-dependent methyltransferase